MTPPTTRPLTYQVAPAAVAVVDDDGRVLHANEAFAALFGDTAGRSLASLGFPPTCGEAWLRGDDPARDPWLTYASTPLPSAPGQHVITVQDRAGCSRAEWRLTEAERLARLGHWSLDLRSGRLEWSPGVYRLFDLDPAHFEVTYQAFLGLVHPDDRAEVDRSYRAALASHAPYEVVHRLRRPDGRVTWVRETRETTWDAQGQPLLSLGTVQDVTEAHLASEALQRQEALLRASLQEKETLLREVHHRVKNNLQLVSSLLSMQAAASPDPALARAMNEARTRLQAMGLLHEHLYRDGASSTVDLAEYLPELARYVARGYQAADAEGMQWTVERLQVSLECAVPLGLVVTELLTNACTHGQTAGRPGHARLEVARRGDDLQVVVSDDGPGLPPGLDWRQGRSLGLKLVQVLMRQLGGAHHIESGPGTVVRLVVPGACAGGHDEAAGRAHAG